MRARRIVVRAEVAPYPMGWAPMLDAGQELRRVRAGFEAVIRFGSSSRMMSWLLCASLWVSSLVTIWMTLGWIGLFMSGHVLSAGAYWMKGLAKRTHAVAGRGNERLDQQAAHWDGSL